MKKRICIFDHCGTEFNTINGYEDIEINDFDFVKEVDLCTDCYNKLCEIVREFIHKERSNHEQSV